MTFIVTYLCMYIRYFDHIYFPLSILYSLFFFHWSCSSPTVLHFCFLAWPWTQYHIWDSLCESSLSKLGLIFLACWLPAQLIFLQMIGFCSFLWLSSVPLCINVCVCLCVCVHIIYWLWFLQIYTQEWWSGLYSFDFSFLRNLKNSYI